MEECDKLFKLPIYFSYPTLYNILINNLPKVNSLAPLLTK